MAREPVMPPVDNGPVITIMIIRLRSVPAALYKALGGFATNGINLTKLESHMLGGSFSAAQFSYIDAECHQESDAFRYALEELKFFTEEDAVHILEPILLIHRSVAKVFSSLLFCVIYPIHNSGRLAGDRLV